MSTARILDAAAQGKGVRLNALPGAPRQARHFVVETLEQWRVPADVIEAAELIVSEVVTNAVLATGRVDGPLEPMATETVRIIRVQVGLIAGSVTIEVWDNSTDPPVLNADPLDAAAEGGRGLYLVGQLSKDWGYWFPPIGGKAVWASVSSQ